ncbi:MAG: glycosyltransferase [Sandaracinaceae bacterium]
MSLALLIVFEIARVALRLMLVVLSWHFLRAVWGGVSLADPERPPDPDEWPEVTVQLPLKDEFYVAERVIRCAVALDYPTDKLSIQVLDDSGDETTPLVRALVEELRRSGTRIEHLHRERPEGFKAGALNAGLERVEGGLVAMFDADCAPATDFLRRTVPFFQDAKIGCVQVRWSFLNRDRNLLTRIQSIVLDGLFTIDQFARATRGLPLQFNGTNGVWRVDAIREAGGWRGEILAEDADLSFRAHLGGWRLVHLRQYAVPTELPEEMGAFRTQQMRWSEGSAQLLRAISWRVVRSELPLRSRWMMFMHLGRHAIDPLILMATVTSPLTTLYGLPFLVDYTVPINAGLFFLVGLGSFLFYGAALRYVRGPWWHALIIPLVIPLAIGMSLAYTVAFVRGLVSASSDFVRTPKAGSQSGPGPRYRSPRPPSAWVEVGIALAHAYFAWRAAEIGLYAEAAFFTMLGGSFLWVGGGTLLSRGVSGRTA